MFPFPEDYQIQKTQNSETSENNSENQENVDPYHNLSINDQSVLHLNNKLAQRLRRDTPSSATTNSISNSNNSSPLAARNAEFYNENRHESPDKRSKLDDSYCEPLSNHSLNNISTFKPEPGFSSTKAEIHLNEHHEHHNDETTAFQTTLGPTITKTRILDTPERDNSSANTRHFETTTTTTDITNETQIYRLNSPKDKQHYSHSILDRAKNYESGLITQQKIEQEKNSQIYKRYSTRSPKKNYNINNNQRMMNLEKITPASLDETNEVMSPSSVKGENEHFFKGVRHDFYSFSK